MGAMKDIATEYHLEGYKDGWNEALEAVAAGLEHNAADLKNMRVGALFAAGYARGMKR